METNFNPSKVKLIVGLGNPDKEYENTYHNAGHLFIDYLKAHNPQPITHNLKTDCFMNSSGGFVKGVVKKKKIKPDSLLIAHDDSDLDLGAYKINFGSGSAGHKGVDSIIKSLGTKHFWRLRIGVRKSNVKSQTSNVRPKAADFVLKKISPKNGKILKQVFGEIAAIINDQ